MSGIAIKAGLTEEGVVLFAPRKLSVDSSRDYMAAIARELAEGGYIRLIIDFGVCEIMDSHGVGELVGIYEAFWKQGGSVTLNRLNKKIARLLETCSMLSLFVVTDSEYSNLVTTEITLGDLSGLDHMKREGSA